MDRYHIIYLANSGRRRGMVVEAESLAAAELVCVQRHGPGEIVEHRVMRDGSEDFDDPYPYPGYNEDTWHANRGAQGMY